MNRRDIRIKGRDRDQVIVEAEATLSGRLVDWHRGEPNTPTWMWVNTLAHCDVADLHDLAGGARRRRGDTWDDAVMFLAAELLAMRRANRDGDPLCVERAQLLELELDLLAHRFPAPTTPSELVSVVNARFARARSRRAHPGA